MTQKIALEMATRFQLQPTSSATSTSARDRAGKSQQDMNAHHRQKDWISGRYFNSRYVPRLHWRPSIRQAHRLSI
jgi:hypothetical protein